MIIEGDEGSDSNYAAINEKGKHKIRLNGCGKIAETYKIEGNDKF